MHESMKRSQNTLLSIGAAIVFLALPVCLPAQGGDSPSLTAARQFLDVLSPEQRNQLILPLDSPVRAKWHFVPREREGLAIEKLDDKQKHALWDLVGTCLSCRGTQQAQGVIRLEGVLRAIEKSPNRDPGKYSLIFWGEPSEDKPWGWRFEGHHLSVNVSMEGGTIAGITPLFLGANPAKVLEGEWLNFRNLAQEEDLTYEFLNSLGREQREKAHLPGEPAEVLGAEQTSLEPALGEGLPVGELDEGRKQVFSKLLEGYLDTFHQGLLAPLGRTPLEILKDPDLVFQWQGGLEKGTPLAWRISGHLIDIQYNNRQNNANHIHVLVFFRH
jgi:hypothetical protein